MTDYVGSNGYDAFFGGPAADRMEGFGGADYLNGNGGDDEILGGADDDVLNGGDGNDTLDGGDGNDSLQGGAGTDIVRGKAGDDRLLVLELPEGDLIDGGDGVDTLQFDGGGWASISFSVADPSVAQDLYDATVVNVEKLAFRSGSGNDAITGGAFDDFINGWSGDDTLDGGLGNDTLDGDFGTDTIHGGGGNDIIRGSGDALFGDAGDDTFRWNEDTLVDGGTGVDQLIIEYSPGSGDTVVDLSDPTVEVDVFGTRVIGVERLWLTTGAGNDRVTGGSGDDVLTGAEGDDTLVGGAGNDILSGGDGADELSGGTGDDLLHTYTDDANPGDLFDGGAGFDTLEFHATNSTVALTIDLLASSGMVTNVERITFMAFGTGTNHVSGAAADDVLWGGSAADYFEGRGGNDDIRANGGDDIVYGGDGDDYIEGGFGANSLYGDAGNDVVRGGGFEANLIDGGAGADDLQGGAGADTLTGGEGNDRLYGSLGADELIGGLGADVFAYGVVWESPAGQEDWLGDFTHGTDKIDLSWLGVTSLSFDALGASTRVTVGTRDGNLVIRAAGSVDRSDLLMSAWVAPIPTQSGGPGNDTLIGSDGADVLDGGAGADRLEGGLGDDGYIVDNPSDTVREASAFGGDDDTVYSSVKFSLGKHVENLVLTGSAPVTGSGNDLANVLAGNAGNNLLKGGGGADTLYGELGDDALNGGLGGDALFGGLGDDLYYVDDAGDVVNEAVGEGTDTISAALGWALGAEVENLILTGTSDINGSGNGLDNLITGNAGANTLKGGAGADRLRGGDGDDVLNGGTGADILEGGLGDDLYYLDDAGDLLLDSGGIDTVSASVSHALGKHFEHLVLTGGAAIDGSGNDLNNALTGNAAANTLKGGAGKDTLAGGLGADTLAGGSGVDRFVFDSALGGSNVDRILDFAAPDDVIVLDRAVFGGLPAGLLAYGAFRPGGTALEADDRILYDAASGKLRFDADGTGDIAPITFALVTPGTDLGNVDFLVV